MCCTLALAACGGGGGDDGGASNNTNNGNNTVNQAPSNVAFNSVTALNATTIETAWSLAKDDKTIASTMRYQVHLSESANFSPSSTTLKFEQRGGLTTQLTDLKASTTYFVKLVVIDEDNAQTVSVEKSVTTPAVAVTNQAPNNVLLGNVTAASQTAVNVAWTAASDDTTPANQLTYEVHLAEGGDFSPSASTLKFSGKNVLSTQLTGLKAATSYSVKLVVVDAQGAKTVSSSKSVTTPAVNVVNQAPTNVMLSSVTAASQTMLDVAWIAASDDTTPANQLTYEVHLAEGGNFGPSASTLKFSGKNVLSTQLTGLKAATSYSVKLIAIDAQGLKTVSIFQSIITPSNIVLETGLLNDTGISQCINKDNVMGNCDVAHLRGGWFGYNQDGQVGRDALAAINQLTKVGGGDAGFDFTKISATGEKLAANANSWNCVLDNHTGLMWDNKTDDGSLHDKGEVFTWYNPDASKNGGLAGTQNNGKNTHELVNTVNIQGWCGYKDWRLPTID
ncbi:MAG: DUF1566 domain-containing protein, partial [Pseudomonadales bacterium]|nr:DUF1566 domain-containing protein [Pseudomonadales bacterium]